MVMVGLVIFGWRFFVVGWVFRKGIFLVLGFIYIVLGGRLVGFSFELGFLVFFRN